MAFNLPKQRIACQDYLNNHANLLSHHFQNEKWVISRIDKFRRAFLWRGHDVDNVMGVTVWLIGINA
jgi:hypothetical protein